MKVVLDEEEYWMCKDNRPYFRMQMKDFSIFRPPSTKRYRKLYWRLKKVEQEEIDRRWNHWHNTFKRDLVYRSYRIGKRLLSWLKRIKVIK